MLGGSFRWDLHATHYSKHHAQLFHSHDGCKMQKRIEQNLEGLGSWQGP
jgi:hypothetical protein